MKKTFGDAYATTDAKEVLFETSNALDKKEKKNKFAATVSVKPKGEQCSPR